MVFECALLQQLRVKLLYIRIQRGFVYVARTKIVLVQCNPGLAVLVAKGN